MRYLKQLAACVLASSLSLTAAAQTLVVGDQSFNARAVMEAAGVLDDLPYTLEWKQFTAGSPVAEALNVGSLDIGLLGDAPPLFLGALGAPIKVIAVSRQNLDGVAILARKDSNIRSLEDLRGKRAAIWKGSWSQQLLFSALDKAAVPRDALELRYLSALDASHALDGGSVDVIATWEPYVTQQERQGARVLATAEGLIPAQSFVVANAKAVEAKRAQISDFLQRLKKARDWTLSDPAHTEAYADAWAKRTRADRDIARAWFARARTDVAPLNPQVIVDAQKTVDFFAGLGLIKNYPASSLFDTSFAAAFDH
ncbi:ABC transporter substrate-binding protein [Pseudomonas putida]|uniref:ABC transporter substrate-binding protein n=1 Tax=Pseudomonas TaxID=286 RepID=UPI000C87DE2D|nr:MULTISPECIES: ABC transporter substrate-binding protein [Pseudomonas]PNB59408.1 sulfonate ABC transporter substrate-binding protein [Pseudomonas sp. FW305-130]EKT4451490.1 ABC transporter substrate-binding protein [Pseudomonas putida]MDD2071100.1 ABC transporter substrate-binding protein [Pseudomonas putida]MDO1497631.1 ABC transporter substrate-binding protein [Pseudomonas putida]PNA99721.1 sulfonate ABC transporter substrate-binding protein [Pseudomonas sp. GW460-5]